MNNRQKTLRVFRQRFMDMLADHQVDETLLRGLVDEAAASPDTFDKHRADKLHEPLRTEPLYWTADYFSRQCRMAGQNFSLSRVRHLIEVRECRRRAETAVDDRCPEIAEQRTRAIAGYTPGDNIRNAVRQGPVSLVRSALINELEDNRLDDYTVYGALAWVEERVAALFDEYEEHSLAGKIIDNPAQWNADYYHLQTVYLNTNFARVRFEHLIILRNDLRQRGVTGFTRIVPRGGRSPETPIPAFPRSFTATALPTLRIAMLTGGAIAVLAALMLALL